MKRWRDLGISWVVTTLPSAAAEEVLPLLDEWQGLIRQAA